MNISQPHGGLHKFHTWWKLSAHLMEPCVRTKERKVLKKWIRRDDNTLKMRKTKLCMHNNHACIQFNPNSKISVRRSWYNNNLPSTCSLQVWKLQDTYLTLFHFIRIAIQCVDGNDYFTNYYASLHFFSLHILCNFLICHSPS